MKTEISIEKELRFWDSLSNDALVNFEKSLEKSNKRINKINNKLF